MVGYGDADFIAVEDPIVGALETDLFVPVPSGASNVRNLLGWGQLTLSVVKVVSVVAAETVSTSVEGGALVGNRDADFVAVEDEVVGALETDLSVPVPSGASYV